MSRDEPRGGRFERAARRFVHPRYHDGRGHGQARQHADHLHQRRQRDERGRHDQGDVQPDDRVQNGVLNLPIAEQMKAYDAWGSAATYPHM